MAPNVTSIDIARAAGVSRSTVSRVFSGKLPVRPEVAERVMAIANDMGYRPNAMAQAVRSGRFDNIALIESSYSNLSTLESELLYGLQYWIDQRNCTMSFARLTHKALGEKEAAPRILRHYNADGMILNINKLPPENMMEVLASEKMPAVWLNIKHEGLLSVYPDCFKAGYDLTKRFIEAGHTRIAYSDKTFGSWDPHYSRPERLAGYKHAMDEVGLPPIIFTEADGYLEHLLKAFTGAAPPTAVICNGEKDRYQILTDVCIANGIQVPSQLVFGGFSSNAYEFSDSYWGMVRADNDMARIAIKTLFERIESPGQEHASVAVPYYFHDDDIPRVETYYDQSAKHIG